MYHGKAKRFGMAIMLIIACLFLCACTGGDEQSPDTATQERVIGSVSYPVNEKGQTYGSSADAYRNLPEGVSSEDVIDYLPDLVLVANEEGIEGYVLKTDFLPPMPDNPDEARSLAESLSAEDAEVPMYDSDGETVLGTWKATTVTIE